MAKKTKRGCVNAKARVRVGRKHGRCHLGKNGRIYCCTSTKPSRRRKSSGVPRRIKGPQGFSTPPSSFVPLRNVRSRSARAYMMPRGGRYNPSMKRR